MELLPSVQPRHFQCVYLVWTKSLGPMTREFKGTCGDHNGQGAAILAALGLGRSHSA